MRTIYIVGMVALLSAMMVMPAAAETWYVHPTDPKDTVYHTMLKASPGDTIFFYNGTYYLLGVMGTESINKPNITWEGEGADVVTLFMQNRAITMEAPGCVFEGFTVVDTNIAVYVRADSPDCIIRDCVFDHFVGVASSNIWIYGDNTTFTRNVVVNTTAVNCVMDIRSSYNKIYLNDFYDPSVYIENANDWNSPEPIEYIYNGTTYTSHLGNYWSDYTGTDAGGDGIGDTSYTIKKPSNVDGYPLMQPFANYPEAKLPDLTTAAVTAHPLVMNQPGTITATIANIGTDDASSFNVSLSVNGSVVNSTSVPALSAGGSTDVIFPWTPASTGDYELCAAADHGDVIRERDEANNDECITVTVGAPDLTPTAITAPPLFVDLTSTITAAIENIGDADASAFNVSLSADGSVVDTASVPSLNAGSLTNVSFSWMPASAGDYELCVVADTDDAIDESDETNNRTCTMVTVSEVSAEIVWQHGALVPWDAERLSNGNTLITELGGHTVTEVTPDGATVWQYGTGTQGFGPGELNCPHDAKRLSSGNTLITDYNNHRVIEVNLSGAIVWQYGTGTAGSGTDQLNYPTDAERLSNGNTLIADRLNNRVIEVGSAGTIVWEMTGLYHPFDADRLDSGNTLIADYRNHRVIEVNPSREIIWQYGTGIPDEYGSGVNELNFPTDAERLSNGDTLIVDAMNDRVIAVRTSDYDPARANNGFITRSIVWEYGSNYPADAERLSNGNTLIAEAGNDRVIEVLTPLAESEPSTPFMIFGEVNHDIDDPILNLNVTVRNTDTAGDFNVEISDNFYQVVTASGRILAGDTLHFCASDDNTTKFDHTVTVEEMDSGGFVQNITIVSPIVWMPDLVVTAINAYHYSTYASAWFNLSNEVDVTIENTGTTPANESNLSLYIDGVFFGSLPVSGLGAGESATVTFTGWMPVGKDCLQEPCVFEWSSEEYNFTAVADCDNDVDELDETNNEITVVDMACYNGYMADEPLENVAHGTLHGGLLFTTGDGQYSSLYSVGNAQVTNYDITLPDGATVELAHLNVYYTWNKPLGTCPEMEVSITTPGGTIYTALPLMKAYNDIKCECEGSAWVLPFGNYVYDLTDYITENGTYTVRVTNVCTACQNFCLAAPGIVLVYGDANAPMIEYWINEGADELIGGRRIDGGSLSLEECINNAAFPGSIDLSTVMNATLGVVSPWGDEMPDDVLYFNEIELGRGVYHGYSSPYSATIDGISMEIGAGNAQVGVNVSDVTDQLSDSNNVAGQGDDGDCMMPANAFLVVECEGEEMIPAGVTFSPKKLDLNSSGVLKAYITLPEGYDVANISVATVECEGAPVFGFGKVIPGKQALEVKFKIHNLTVPTGDSVLLTVTGELYDGTPFEGSDTVEVIGK